MRNLWKHVLGVWVIGTGIAMSASALAANAVGPYYATPSWDQTLPAATRFIVLTNMSSEAVLDRETGLVWEQSPSTNTSNWRVALNNCAYLTKGGRKGWRLPTIQDLASLIDPAVAYPGPTLPPGHPFSNVQPAVYWSASTIADVANYAWGAFFDVGAVGSAEKSVGFYITWCVRGGQGVDPQ